MAQVNIEQDGLIYSIDLQRSGSGEKMEAILEQDAYGWKVQECTRGRRMSDCWGANIGRREKWTRALAEALELMESELESREGST
jgi:hypothetical protein